MKKIILAVSVFLAMVVGASANSVTVTGFLNPGDIMSWFLTVSGEEVEDGHSAFVKADTLAMERWFVNYFPGTGTHDDLADTRLDLYLYPEGTNIGSNSTSWATFGDGSSYRNDACMLTLLTEGIYRMDIMNEGDGRGNYNILFSSEADLAVSDTAPQAPVPEPATMFLLGTGLCGLFGIKKRKKA